LADDREIPIILGSGSPRRRELLNALGMPFLLSPADIDEKAIEYRTPRELALKTAFAKACAVEPRFDEGLIVAADTIVVLDGKVYGKPEDPADAMRMLLELNGKTHTVISGVAIKEIGKSSLLDAVETAVRLVSLSPAEIEDYVATGEPLDKAGAYAIQGTGRKLVDGIEGDFYNVVGLPLKRLLDMMEFFTDTTAYQCRLKTLNWS
jgi:septum formation protein